MPRHPVSAIPDGYTIIRYHGKHYPMQLSLDTQGVPSALGFMTELDHAVVSYSKRSYAVNFLILFEKGAATWALVKSPTKNITNLDMMGIDGIRRNDFEDRGYFLTENEEYTAHIEHVHTTTASEY